MEHLLGNLDTSQDAVLLNQKVRLTHRILGDATECGMVTVTDIFSKRQVNKPVNEFFNR